MSNIVFILGAGASKEAGAPLMKDFLSTARQFYRSMQSDSTQKSFATVFNAIGKLQNVHSKAALDLDNIEVVFATFQMAQIVARFPGNLSADEIKRLPVLIREVIAKTLEETVKNEIPAADGSLAKFMNLPAQSEYGQFANLLYQLTTNTLPPRRHNVSVITFNYDVALDAALMCRGLGPDYSFGEPRQDGHIPLLKLHGSLNWSRCPKCKEIVPWHLEDYLKWSGTRNVAETGVRSFANLRLSSDLSQYRHEKCMEWLEPSPFLVPPTWNKFDHYGDVATIWSAAADKLAQAEHIVVVGYSYPETDVFFHHLYALGTVGDNPLETFAVADPNGMVKNRFKALMGTGAKDSFRENWNSFHDAIVGIGQQFNITK